MTHFHSGLASTRNKLLATRTHQGGTFRSPTWTQCLLLMCIWGMSAFAAADQTQASSDRQTPILQDETLDNLITHALTHNPDIGAALANYEAALEQVPQETAWPNPQLSVRYFLEELQTRVGPQDYAVGLSQPLPWPKRLKFQGEAASQAALAAAAEVDEVRARVTSEVTRLWVELALLTHSIAIVQANRDLVVAFESVVRTRYATGSARHPDVIRAQIELANIENQLASLKDRRNPLRAALNALLHRPSYAQIPEPTELELNPVRRDDQDLLRDLGAGNPKLKRLGFETAASKARFKRAQTASLPEFTVGLDYIVIDKAAMPGIRGSGQDPISASLRITLPISRGKFRAEEQQAEASLTASSARQSAELNALRSLLMSTLYEIRDAEREVVLYRTVLLPKAKESLGALQRAYSSGAASFTELIDAQRLQLELELGEARALARHQVARAKLEEVLGGPLDSSTQPEEQS